MRRASLGFAVVVLVGVLAFALVAFTKGTREAFSFNVPVSGPAAKLKPGQRVCQYPIDVPIGGAFDTVRVPLGTVNRPGPRVDATLRDAGAKLVARATIAPGFLDNSSPPIRLGRRFDGTGYKLCLRNRGDAELYVYGSGGDAVPTSGVTVAGKPVDVDLSLIFERSSRSLGSMTSDILQRATLFRSPRLSSVAYGLLLLLLLVVAAGGVLVALRSAERSPQPAVAGDGDPGASGEQDAGDDTDDAPDHGDDEPDANDDDHVDEGDGRPDPGPIPPGSP